MHASTVLSLAFSGAAAAHWGPPSGHWMPHMAQAPSTDGFKDAVVHPSSGGKGVCVSGYIPVEAMTEKNMKLNFEAPKNQTAATEVFIEMITPGSGFMERIAGGMATVKGTYDIYSTICVPLDNPKPKGVQMMTHGVGFEGSYWDFAQGYSYVDTAVEHGYAVFFYDRLSVGKSEKVDAITTAQAPLEMEIANSLGKMLRSGKMCGHGFEKVVGGGHSFGSLITQGITAHYPETFDAAILTGFSVNMSALQIFTIGNNFALARENQPLRFNELPPGYLVSDTAISQQIGFFKAPGFDPKILAASEAVKGTVTYGELLTTAAVSGVAKNFTGPVAVVDGANDLPFCVGNCSYPHNLADAVRPALYPNLDSKKFGSYLAPLAGHGLNLHYSAEGAYEYTQKFLEMQGLGM